MASSSESERDKGLDEIYYNPEDPCSYGGVQRLLKRAREKGIEGINLKVIREYLTDQQAYSLHKPARKNFKRNKTITSSIDKQWQADLCDMQAISRSNDGFKYILTVIDIFSKYAWGIPVKTKSSGDMVDAFTILFNKSKPRTPQRLQTDAGKEFINKEVQSLLKNRNIHFFFSGSEKKAAVVERFNRTLKSRIWTYLTAKESNLYIDVLDKIVNAYNHSYHRTIGMRPVDVEKKMEPDLFLRMYGDQVRKRTKSALKPGDKVRISKVKGHFEKGYMPNWSQEEFHVTSEGHPGKKHVYKLRDKGEEELTGTLYKEELQPIKKNQYLIEKVLRKRKNPKGDTELLVKWKGWPAKFNSWIPEADTEKLSRPKND